MLTMLRHEWRLQQSDRVGRLILIVFLIAAGYAVYNGKKEQDNRVAETAQVAAAEAEWRAKNQEDAKAIWAKLEAEGGDLDYFLWDARNPYRLGTRYGAQVTMPQLPMGALAVGRSDILPLAYRVSAADTLAFEKTEYKRNPLRLATGHFDMGFLILYMMPLMLLVASFNMISEDRDNGNARLLFAGGVLTSQLLASKLLIRALTIIGPVLVFSLIGFLWAGGGSEGSWGRFLLWSGVTLIYGIFWLGLALWVNGLGRSSATNAVILAVAWIGLVVVVPAMVNVAAETAYPVPSKVSFVNAQRTASAEATEAAAETMADFLGDHPELAKLKGDRVNYAINRVVRDQTMAGNLKPVLDEQEQQVARQQALFSRWGFLSPAILVYGLQLDSSGTSSDRHAYFMDQLKTFRGDWHSFFETKYFEWKPMQPEVYDQAPAMTYQEEAVGAVLSRGLGPIIGLLIFVSIVLIASTMRFRNWRIMV